VLGLIRRIEQVREVETTGAQPKLTTRRASASPMVMGFASLNPILRIGRHAPSRNARRSLLRLDPEAPPCRRGGAVVASGAEFDAAINDAEIEPMDEAAVAALLAKIAHARARPFAIGDDAIDDPLGHDACVSLRQPFSSSSFLPSHMAARAGTHEDPAVDMDWDSRAEAVPGQRPALIRLRGLRDDGRNYAGGLTPAHAVATNQCAQWAARRL
jgi:hypothetical protein